ncbi:MAG: hypothetical protein WAK94_05325 [Steroidobacteraceae bacterium]
MSSAERRKLASVSASRRSVFTRSPGRRRDLRYRDHLAAITPLDQCSSERVTARSRLVGYVHPLGRARVRERFEQLSQLPAAGSEKPGCRATGLSEANGNGILMNIQTDESSGIVIHGLSPVMLTEHADSAFCMWLGAHTCATHDKAGGRPLYTFKLDRLRQNGGGHAV